MKLLSDGDIQPRVTDPVLAVLIRNFAADVVRAAPDVTARQAQRQFAAVVEFAGWGWDSGLPLDVGELFDRSVIAYYQRVGCGHLNAAGRAARGEVLSKLGAAYSQRSRPVQQRTAPLVAPYSPLEQLELISWARAQSTVGRRADAHVLLAVGFGAGLTAREIIGLRSADVQHVNGAVTLWIRSARPRTVPVLERWAPLLPTLSGNPAAFVFRPNRTHDYVNAITNFTGRDNPPRVHVKRLRSTWIITQLDAGTPLPILLDAAGIDGPDALQQYLRYTVHWDDERRERLLRYAASGP